ncbi:MAG: adenine deaminase C-terminal domain-containing protein, partial [Anaerolineaceae bacterium]
RVVRFAISQGLKPITALQMATINTAEYFGVSEDMGLIAPGRCADILLVSDLISLKVEQVFCQGKLIAENGKLLVDLPAYSFPEWATHSMQLPRKLSASDFRIHSVKDSEVKANVIGIIENQAPTRHIRAKMTPNGGDIHADMKRDIAKLALIDRHTGSGRVQMGLVQGFGFNVPCAVATTVAHDSHQMIVVGTDDDDMAAAANELAACGGGQAVVSRGEVIGRVDLPIAGLMAAEHAEVVAKKAATVLNGFRTCGCTLNNPNMQLSLLALVVIPSLRISDLGLVDVEKFKFIPVIE